MIVDLFFNRVPLIFLVYVREIWKTKLSETCSWLAISCIQMIHFLGFVIHGLAIYVKEILNYAFGFLIMLLDS